MNRSEHQRKLDKTMRHYLALDQAPGAVPQAENTGKAQLERIVTLLREAVLAGKLDRPTFVAVVKALGGDISDVNGMPAPATDPNDGPTNPDGGGGPYATAGIGNGNDRKAFDEMFPEVARILPDETYRPEPPKPYAGMSEADAAEFYAMFPDLARLH